MAGSGWRVKWEVGQPSPSRCRSLRRIVRAGRTRFERASLERLWEDATSSVRHQLTPEYVDLLDLNQLWAEFLLYEQRTATLAQPLRLRASSVPKIWLDSSARAYLSLIDQARALLNGAGSQPDAPSFNSTR